MKYEVGILAYSCLKGFARQQAPTAAPYPSETPRTGYILNPSAFPLLATQFDF